MSFINNNPMDINQQLDQLINFDDIKICKDTQSCEIIDNTIPKITISNDTPHFINSGKETYIIYINTKDKHLLQLIRENKMGIINEKYKIFKINEQYLYSFINDVLNTDSKYVYPMVFVNFVKVSLHTSKKISFDNDELLKLRVWSNQLRMTHGFESFNRSKRNRVQFKDIELYLGYKICCEILYYIIYIADNN